MLCAKSGFVFAISKSILSNPGSNGDTKGCFFFDDFDDVDDFDDFDDEYDALLHFGRNFLEAALRKALELLFDFRAGPSADDDVV